MSFLLIVMMLATCIPVLASDSALIIFEARNNQYFVTRKDLLGEYAPLCQKSSFFSYKAIVQFLQMQSCLPDYIADRLTLVEMVTSDYHNGFCLTKGLSTQASRSDLEQHLKLTKPKKAALPETSPVLMTDDEAKAHNEHAADLPIVVVKWQPGEWVKHIPTRYSKDEAARKNRQKRAAAIKAVEAAFSIVSQASDGDTDDESMLNPFAENQRFIGPVKVDGTY